MVIGASVLAGAAILVGLVGIVVPVLPGLVLVWAAVLGWAIAVRGAEGWWILGIATLFLVLGWVAQFLVPGKRLRSAGIPNRTSLIGLVVGAVGFFVVPVLGLPIGFVLGVYAAEVLRVGSRSAWGSTKHAVGAALVGYGIEFSTGMAIALAWLVGVCAFVIRS